MGSGDIAQLKKDFTIFEDLSEVKFTLIKKENYKNQDHYNAFGEKLCTVYKLNFNVFNVFYCMKLLVFFYDNSCEILKLELQVQDADIEKEIIVCRNRLQRHRNVNFTFLMLKKVSRFIETRRLISEIIFKKEPRVNFQKSTDGTLEIKYKNDSPDIFISFGWKIEWDIKNCDVVDVIEVYYNNFEIPNMNYIKELLVSLTHPTLEFSVKLKFWRQLFESLGEYDNRLQPPVVISDNEQEDNVLVISDSEDDRDRNEERFHKRKRRKLQHIPNPQVINVID
ncbi:unnamed protein product [Phyllotreta striolata]|uniref:Uncharacterized protein n=1 Tax=Phyllotreta striolata TaxID=444603 RepID=A0A9N9XS20_PHYSR|nr:unnamed protein product [Phyllotreta striolata]